MRETYEYSKLQVRKSRLREAATALPGVLLIAFFGGLYAGNPIAQQVAEMLVEYWNSIVVGALLLTAIGAHSNMRR